MTTTRFRAATAATAACLLLFAGCGSDSDDDTSDSSKDDTSQESSPTDDDASDEESDAETDDESDDESGEAAEAPDGYETVTAEGAGLEFAAPEDWEEFDAESLEGKDAELDEYAKGLNITVDQLKQMMSQVDVMLLDTNGDNVNVVIPPGVTELPDQDTLRSQFEALNATVDDVTEVDTPLGTGQLITYTLQGRSGSSLFVEVTKGVANVTVTMGSPEDAESTMDIVTSTLVDVG